MKKLLTAVFFFSILFCMKERIFGADHIKWVDFTPTEDAIRDTFEYDVSSYGSDHHLRIYESLAALSVKNGGNFNKYKKSDFSSVIERYESGEKIEDIAANEKLYNYYFEVYKAIFDGIVCEYDEYTVKDGDMTVEHKYGLCAYSPFAAGYYYNHYDDFGASRSYGYKRRHLGHDMLGSIGTPIVAVEAGYVEACGWNQYGGWRIGIRSFDGKRYYYYAHLRKNHPYSDIYEGKIVAAGEVIGYLGMTGYSAKENTNNIDTPHLHFGLELIFAPEQKDGYNQIWIDMYSLTNFLAKYRAEVVKKEAETVSVTYKIPTSVWD